MLRPMPVRRCSTLVALVTVAVLVACGPDDGRELAEPNPDLTAIPVPTTSPAAIVDLDPALTSTGPGGLTINGTDFGPGENLPVASGCNGPTSPGLTWTAPPRRATELALVVQDVDGNGAIQWLVTGIPTEVRGVREGQMPAGGDVRANSTGTETWTSPCPQDGQTHRLVFSLYVLDSPLPQGAGDAASIVEAVRSTAFGAATVVGRAALPVTG
jgi:phosphatidylethanolamine-binding protein (PEBP) family uncharacterized protein